MQTILPAPTHTPGTPSSDAQVIAQVRAGQVNAFEVLMRRYNQLVFRTVRSITRSDAEAEDIAQDAWIAAYQHLAQFAGKAAFSTWVTRIAIRLAVARTRRQRRWTALDDISEVPLQSESETPANVLQQRQVAALLEQAIDGLPMEYRLVLVLRDVEQRSTEEAAQALGLSEENVRVRLHRARAALRERLQAELGSSMRDVFAFDGPRCDRIVANVLAAVTVAQTLGSE